MTIIEVFFSHSVNVMLLISICFLLEYSPDKIAQKSSLFLLSFLLEELNQIKNKSILPTVNIENPPLYVFSRINVN